MILVDGMKKTILLIAILSIALPALCLESGEVLYKFGFDNDLDGFSANTGTWLHSGKNPFSFTSGEFVNRAGGFVIIDSEESGGKSLDASISSPAMNISPGEQLLLEFDHYFRQAGGEKGIVEVSSNNGMSWTPAREYSGRSFNGHDIVHLNPFIEGAADKIRVRFRYTDAQNAWFWALDNVKLTGVKSAQVISEQFVNTSDFNLTKTLHPAIDLADGYDCCTIDYELVVINHDLEVSCFSFDINGKFDFLSGAGEGYPNSTGYFNKIKSTEKIGPGISGSVQMLWNDNQYYARGGETVLTIDITNILNTPNAVVSYYLIAKYNQFILSELK